MKRLILYLLAASAAVPWPGRAADEKPSYSLSLPTASVLRNTSDATANEWLASNRAYAVVSCASAAPTVSSETVAGNPVLRLDACEAGFAFERIKPEVWLGGTLIAPVGVDWTKTYEAYLEAGGEATAFVFDPKGERIYAQTGGTHAFTWVLSDGTRQTRNYVISSVCEGRPYRMFWTDAPYNAPPVNMSGRYIRLFGPDEIVKPVYGTQVVDQNGQRITNSNVIVSGVFLDSSSACLYARGKVAGQFLVAFYDSGSYETLQRLQVVEVGEPGVNYMKGYIGEKIEPYGTGYDTTGLYPSPVTLGADANDTSGTYYYQHKGAYSYSPKNNWVYPLRTTEGEAWRLDVYWMETDAHGISWPFERCNYACSWPTNRAATLIAGAPVKIPDGYGVTLGSFQEPEGHARAPEGDIFKTQGAGFSLLKVSGQDNIWFIPVRSIARTDTNFFTLAESEWFVGDELRPRGGSVRGTAGGYAPVIDTTVPGLLNLAESGDNYNPNLYYDWTATSNDLASVIYAVNTVPDTAKPLEVWWSSTVQQEGMATPIAFPSLVQRYRIAWPAEDQVPQIVLASQQGGAGTTRYETGACAYLDNAEATLALPDAYAFHATGGAISFWACAEEMSASGNVLALGTADNAPLTVQVTADFDAAAGQVAYRLALSDDAGGQASLATPALATDVWHKVVFSFGASNLTAFVDGVCAASTTVARAAFGGFLAGNRLGGGTAAAGLDLDDVAVWARTFDAAAASNTLHAALSGEEDALTFAFAFEDDDLEPTFGGTPRTATDRVSGRTFAATEVLRATPGAPVLGTGVFAADATPTVYRQPDMSKPGYNPNEEHAFIASGAGGYYAWALRCDLNTAATSKPFVLAEYVANGHAAMRAFSVLLTNEVYMALAADVEAGHMLPGPHPIDLFDTPWCPAVSWDSVPSQPYASAFRDRKGQVWARAAGTIPIRMYYRNQAGFDYPSLATTPAVNAEIPWLSELGQEPSAHLLENQPAVWTWRVAWPSGVPTMRIGQTLTTAANGLPEVWNAKSMAVVWPQGETDTVRLWDPTVARESGADGYKTAAELLADFGFTVDAGNVTLRAGKYTFKDLPPSIGDRFYVDVSKAVRNCVTLIGKQETNAGGSILWPNVANQAEIDALKNLPPADLSAAKRAAWAALIDGLGLSAPVAPTTVTDPLDPEVAYIPRDHYALTAMGKAGYVTIIENDAPVGTGVGQLGVQDGDAISMHVFAVTNRYYAGRVVAREDPLNLLSQKLAILYTESFAGEADDYEFEWKKATPTASGAMPTDYTNAYARVFSDPGEMLGLTRFTLGEQGDTLANLVNTFYVMRYRAVGGAAKETMGDTWSDWCGPTLAEGWIQRVVNNVTPFTQRMTDLYENRAETASSMIQAAGGPYMGDVALNQDNLTSVGLIQLYQTLLNKAESMSIASGAAQGVNDAEVNKQLLLAVERLADLYTLLGNDAYADALNPTIGFGTTWGEAAPGMMQIDYGAASPGLFCFDNQVPTLLDEELALLRGRTGANNPSVQTAPFYNRLVWNFTRGITAGEVAYAVNYNVNSSNGDATIDENDAALQYPQGHGDAWGHYLSALTAYYRLLRNPNFTWPVSQSQMLVADAVVDVDYYDEARFAEIANKLAVTAAAVADRTARKAWRDNGGANGAGFLDDDTARNFGYGEWATRGAIGAVANWMVANAILPEAETADACSRLVFGPETYLSNTNLPLAASADLAHGWTFEFQVAAPTNLANIGKGVVLTLAGVPDEDALSVGRPATDDTDATVGFLQLFATGDGQATVTAQNITYYVMPETNYVTVVETNATTGEIVTTPNVEKVDYGVRYDVVPIIEGQTISLPDGALVALDRTVSGATTLRVLDTHGASRARLDLGHQIGVTRPMVLFGGGFTGTIGEIRGWSVSRSDAELHAARAYVNPREPTLAFYTRGTTWRTTDATLADETPGGDCPWEVESPQWARVAESGLSIAFSDDGLLRIDRTTVTDLAAIPTSVEAIQRTLDHLDAGLNPLGLSDAATPFDISSAGVAEGTSTHFEQIAARAETALGNAAKLLDRAQTAANYRRQIQNATSDEEELAETSEADYESQLIAIYGTPYSGDIGPGKMYEQGYTGPDLYHYMYMDLSGYGLTSVDDITAKYVVSYDDTNTKKKWSYESMADYAQGNGNRSTKDLVYCVSANGLIVKPSSVSGSRTTSGRLQQAYSDYLLAYVDAKNAAGAYTRATELLKLSYETVDTTLSKYEAVYGMSVTLRALTGVNIAKDLIMQNTINALNLVKEVSDTAYKTAMNSTPSIIGAGLTCIFSPQYAISVSLGNANLAVSNTVGGAILALESVKLATDAVLDEMSNAREGTIDDASWNDAQNAAWDGLYDAVMEVRSAAIGLQTAVAKMNSLVAAFDTLVAEGDRLQSAREAERAKRVNRIVKLRYNDMLFRRVEDAALSRYATAFDFAQRQTFLAAQAYDYETAQLSSDAEAGDAFKAEIVGARALGTFGSDGKPQTGVGYGDAGLADILARMQTNYQVLKPRLGINNPESNATWFSLRHGLFRIDRSDAGLADWQKELEKHLVDDLRDVSEYVRYCQPLAATGGLAVREPALVIPFETTIDFGKNLFGRDLTAGDTALDSSYFATKIRSAGVRFVGYNAPLVTGAPAALAATPVVYLVPVGTDRMRVPGDLTGLVLDRPVVDQVIPVPYAIGSTALDSVDFSALACGFAGVGEPGARIRRFPSFRAMTGSADDADRANTRLIGRSAWNTRWVLIIPAGQMLGGSAENRQTALDIFIHGADTDHDGQIDVSPVTDIELGLKTYSHAGN